MFTTNPLFGEIDAVAEPLAIKFESNASSVKAERGIFVNPAPLPLKNPPPIGIVTEPLTEILPLKVEPLATEVTNKPVSGATEAVTLPLTIRNTSLANADWGISNNPLPLPVNIDADTGNWNVENVFTTNPSTGEIDAVAEPLNIFVESIAKLAKVILERYLPSPTKNEEVGTYKLPLTIVSPINLIVGSIWYFSFIRIVPAIEAWCSQL